MNAFADSARRHERVFYLCIAFAFLALVLWTFARTFYLKLMFGTPELPLLVHIHGVVMTGWPVLLAVQTSLVASRRVQWHKEVGVFGSVWAGLVVLLGSVTTIHAAVREVRGHTPMAGIQVFITTLDLLQMLLFGAFVTAAILLRKRPDYHKRFMVMTIACMLPDAFARLPVSWMTNGRILIGLYGFVLLCVAIDTFRHRRLHPAFAWAGLVFLFTFQLALFAARSKAWIAFASGFLS